MTRNIAEYALGSLIMLAIYGPVISAVLLAAMLLWHGVVVLYGDCKRAADREAGP